MQCQNSLDYHSVVQYGGYISICLNVTVCHQFHQVTIVINTPLDYFDMTYLHIQTLGPHVAFSSYQIYLS